MNTRKLASAIIKKAKALGASLAGLAGVADLKKAPSFTFAQMLADADTRRGDHDGWPGRVTWPENAQSTLVIAIEHPLDKPEMDWWFGESDPPGNHLLARVITDLCNWITQSIGIQTFHMPYQVAKGGTYLKDVAVLAGLGCIGKNNLLVTPEYGPRVRLRALTLDVYVPVTGPIDFDPCIDCDAPCQQSCPQGAFNHLVYKSKDNRQDRLPGRNGVFSRPLCFLQMEKDIAAAEEKKIEPTDKPVRLIKYCRCCEYACPVGK